tara:strand:- start:93 stop:254 length:162 start_codon:yes stop_codon:yes gene_type:complete
MLKIKKGKRGYYVGPFEKKDSRFRWVGPYSTKGEAGEDMRGLARFLKIKLTKK